MERSGSSMAPSPSAQHARRRSVHDRVASAAAAAQGRQVGQQQASSSSSSVVVGGGRGAGGAVAPADCGVNVITTGNPVPRIDFDGSARTVKSAPPPPDVRSHTAGEGGSQLLIWLITAPSVLAYLVPLILHWVPVTVEDSEGVTHSVRLRLAINFAAPWITFWFVDMFCLCPAHFWLTLYGATRRVDWSGGRGNARCNVEAVAAAVESLTHTEAIHFCCTLVPTTVASSYAFMSQGDLFLGVGLVLFLVALIGGQWVFKILGQIRSGIVRFRGPATSDFAWGALKGSLRAATCAMLWGARCQGYWMDQPIILPVDMPPDNLLHPPSGAKSGYARDIWQGLHCGGRPTGDPVTPWVINVSSCDPAIFIAGGRHVTSPNATFPSQWTALGFRRFQFMIYPNFCGSFTFFCYQPLVGVGMFSSMVDLRYHWTEGLAAACLFCLAAVTLLEVIARHPHFATFN
jgi:hypothetical protein